MPQIKIAAPAKLNLHLRIGGKRPDGFHAIDSLFLALAFGDIIHVETTDIRGLEIHTDWQLPGSDNPVYRKPEIPLAHNIIAQAVSLFRTQTGYDTGLTVTVEKRIPLGGGLGGGSSDAAATLLALNRLATSSAAGSSSGLLDNAALAAMGASLGSDVPFFLYDNAPLARVRGRGEQVQTLDPPESLRNCFFVLVNPGFPSDTAAAYRILDKYRESAAAPAHAGGVSLDKSAALLDFLSGKPEKWPFFNDFLPAFRAGNPEKTVYGELVNHWQHIFTCLREYGAEFVGLSGSGSTCFGVFSNRDKAEIAEQALKKHWSCVFVTILLAYRLIQYYNNETYRDRH